MDKMKDKWEREGDREIEREREREMDINIMQIWQLRQIKLLIFTMDLLIVFRLEVTYIIQHFKLVQPKECATTLNIFLKVNRE